MSLSEQQKIDLKKELVRKGIHIFSLSIPIVGYYVCRQTALLIFIPLAIMALIVDSFRYKSKIVAQIFYFIFGKILRQHEVGSKKTLTGGTYVLISAALCVFLFPKILFVMGFSILIISDTIAAFVGKTIGKHKINGKTFEGSLAFFVSAVFVIILTPKITYSGIEYLIGFIGAFIGTIVELFSFGLLDDNFSIPLSIGGVMWLLYMWLLPNVNIYGLVI
jgi:dolichol kinase